MQDVDHDQPYATAASQAGYFTAGQEIGAGMDRSTLRHHARPGGRYERVGRGVYRLRHFPTSPLEQVELLGPRPTAPTWSRSGAARPR